MVGEKQDFIYLPFDCCCQKTPQALLRLMDTSETNTGNLEISELRSGNKSPKGTLKPLIPSEHSNCLSHQDGREPSGQQSFRGLWVKHHPWFL